jgi:hypothetical protein
MIVKAQRDCRYRSKTRWRLSWFHTKRSIRIWRKQSNFRSPLSLQSSQSPHPLYILRLSITRKNLDLEGRIHFIKHQHKWLFTRFCVSLIPSTPFCDNILSLHFVVLLFTALFTKLVPTKGNVFLFLRRYEVDVKEVKSWLKNCKFPHLESHISNNKYVKESNRPKE